MDYEIDGVRAEFSPGTKGWILKQLKGSAQELALPAQLPDGKPLCELGDKALLGQKYLVKLKVPESVYRIGDWAMAGCISLKEVHIPACTLGKGVFRDCAALKRLYMGGQSENAALLAEAARQDAAYLLDVASVGKQEWYEAWDNWLRRFLEESDQEGYTGQVPCGEEDYGSFDVASYESGRRREKARRCLIRLMNPVFLDEAFHRELRSYIARHSAGSQEGDEAWQLILSQFAEEEEWYSAFAEAGGLDCDAPEALIAEIPESFAGMKSYFLRFLDEHKEGGSLWTGLEL